MIKFFDIVSNDVGEFYEWFGMSSTYPKKIQQAILNDEDNEIVLDIASNGGDVFAASEIYTMLRDSQKNIVVNIQGLAASAASVIAFVLQLTDDTGTQVDHLLVIVGHAFLLNALFNLPTGFLVEESKQQTGGFFV